MSGRKAGGFPPGFHLFLLILAVRASAVHAEQRPYYFYRALPYGSQMTYNPLNVVINGGYGILQIPEYYGVRDVGDLPYREWTKAMWKTAGHPLRTLNDFGWKRFATTEVVPTTLDMNNAQWVPNYFLHLLGAGMLSRKTEEWYRYQGYSHPRAWSVATMTAYHVLTEVIETKGDTAVTSDHLADLGIFDPLSVLLWTNDGVCKFFSEKLQLQEWSMQPAINLKTGNLENMGQFYVIKYPITRDKSWSVMAHFGMHGTFGLSRRMPDGRAYSLTGGLVVENLIPAKLPGPGQDLTAKMTWRVGAFYDRNNSLLTSLMLCGIADRRIKVNIYPGVVHIGPFTPGFFLSGTKEWVAGMNISYFPLGVAQGLGNGTLSQ